ncbi:DUF4810 domain-containing protein [Methylovorus mays]|uniref:DUF4810 domain-containing protein n=1 Tax=Methylovorus mays TaxID=184077 RepID=UPI001E4609CA|nr:DUF4810 domain-containing protein [Methylovorus mays]MCB5206838.1 DUF4810 domain-containing protein [Methylovorus mays]
MQLPILFIWPAACLLLLGGCATEPKTLYGWGGYQAQLNHYFKADSAPEQQIGELEAELAKMQVKGQKPPPGYLAHIGFLYASIGNAGKSAEAFNNEKKQFPESAVFMDLMLKRLKGDAQ